MPMGLFSGKSDNIGIDIGKSSIIGVRISGTATDPVLRKFHERQIPEGLVFEGEVLDAESLGDELKAFVREAGFKRQSVYLLSLIHISEPTRRTPISYAVFCLKKKKKKQNT